MKLSIIVVLFAIFISSCTSTDDTEFLGQFSVLQGYTTGKTTQFSILTNKNANLRFFYKELGDDSAPLPAPLDKLVQRENSSYGIYKLKLGDLKPDREYELQIISATGDTRTYEFATLSKKGQNVRFAVASCLSDSDQHLPLANEIWPEIFSQKPQMIFLIGDNVYADMDRKTLQVDLQVTPDDLWKRYVESRFLFPVFRQKKLIPIIATWDDHDFGLNNGDGSFMFKRNSAEMFNDFYAQDRIKGMLRGPGISTYFKGFKQNFVFLDNRYFRTPNNKGDQSQSHWGARQENWLIKILNLSSRPTWIFNGDQIWADYHRFESYKINHPKSFAKFMPKIGKAKSPVIFVSGDRHLSELIKVNSNELPYETWELTTSGVHAKMYPRDDSEKEANIVFRNSASPNYAIVDAKSSGKNLVATLQLFGPNKKELFKKKVFIGKAK